MDYMTDLIIENGVVIGYNGTAKHLVIPSGVKGIGDGAFAGCTTLESVCFPNGCVRPLSV